VMSAELIFLVSAALTIETSSLFISYEE